MKEIYFATSNYQKVIEASSILLKYNLKIIHLPIERIEIQSPDLCEIASYSVSLIIKKINKPVFVEDTGLFIEKLKGFPGPYSSYVFKTIGNDGILKLMENEKNRNCIFKSVISYCKPNSEPKCITAEVEGLIAEKQRGKGWGYDPIFIPKEIGSRTYAEMELDDKNQVSHRYKVLKLFAETYFQNSSNP
jgi:XTP/dITP diphosphohydrolase